ncbi:MAG: glucose 1-dehydrogenase [Coriobacteriia bacterium]|nr:glucose 1-dehydrogenase [Coriobacteriia bacterium]MCL2537232.1 glucose 1-dehydrogenase [Coriobacteriia bacterium]
MTSIFSLTGKTALVTGAATGIGRAIALDMATAGADIALNHYGTPEAAAEVRELIEGLGRRCEVYDCDVASYDACKQMAADVLGDFGRLDILVNNAGIARDNPLLRISETDYDEVMDVNLKSAFSLTKHFYSHFMKNRAGSIINIASVCGLNGWVWQTNYAASKGGMIALTKTTAKELAGRGITCNAICPGFIATNMTAKLKGEKREDFAAAIPARREGKPEDVSALAVFLASDGARYITGETIRVDGGLCI